MILPDVNVLVYAHREDAADHSRYRLWLEEVVNAESAYGMADIVLSGFMRIVTHPKIFAPPSPLKAALGFAQQVRDRQNCVICRPGPGHWRIFTRLCKDNSTKGNLIPDAYLAALAIESGCEWITTDGDYARFSGLKWRHPLAASA